MNWQSSHLSDPSFGILVPSLCVIADGIRCWMRDNGDRGWRQFGGDDGDAGLARREPLAINVSAFTEPPGGVLRVVKLADITLRGLRQGIRCVAVS